jgi:hypothetical protein
MSDAQVAARWLNESHQASHDRVLGIYNELESLRSGFVALQALRDTSPAIRALRDKTPALEIKPDAAWSARYRREHQRLEKKTNALNKTLRRYAFRPGVGYTVITDMRGAGLVPDANKRTRLIVGEWELVEADAVLSLVRLYLRDELHRVQLCEMCKKRWRVKAKKHYRFCSSECREAYYSQAPDYDERRKQIQQNYRDRKKRNLAAGWRPKP